MRLYLSTCLSFGFARAAIVAGCVLLTAPLARGAQIQQVLISESGKTEVRVRFVADVSPTFQVQEKNPLHFFIELPGTQIKADRVKSTTGLLLQKSAAANTRLDLFFNGAVDYDASVNKNTLTVTFTHLGERLELERVRDLQQALRKKTSRPKPAAAAAVINNKGLEEQKKTIERDIATLQAQKSKDDKALAAKKGQLATVQSALKRAKSELSTLAAKSKSAKAQVADLNKNRRGEEKALESLKKTNVVRAKENDALSKSVNALNAEIKRLNTEKKTLLGESQSLQKKTAQQKLELASLKKKESIKESLAELNAQKNKASATLASLGKDIDALRQESKKTKAALKSAETKTQQEKKQQQSLVAETKRLVAERESARRAQSKAQKDAQLAALQNDKAQKSAQASVAKQRQAESKLQKLVNAQKSAEQKRNHAQNALASLAKQEQQKKTQLAALDAQAKRARARPAPREQPAARRRPSNNIESAGRLATNNGFGGGTRSVTISKAGKVNPYVRASAPAGDEVGRGVLGTITVQRDDQNGGRVGIRVDGGARYSITRASERKVVLTLFDTRAANLDVRRILDARSLGTKVLRVLPRVEEGQRQRVELTIELRDAARVRVGHDDSMLWLLVG